ncbi:MAG: DUF3179 domain-containing protein [Candidatus Magasanikbacteria bacterium]|jgi:thiol-disulfide isomerase/thioredoxin|nr:DUF3179 domain-containing protein [Candidatus Magasanikbacteria bacterium]MBT4221271.1 DUF3179 domain-containing protein [Candidatus Magasanikbacteria bacterium]MBT4350417.1 DUF3179 domain-containing protein [Candidatus Magasanikbacteria bacterium]MBT4542036.1 DUF3179 domain-containing protein [Candidatus Magasanikbacteria bacterium]MBT6253395.1 DUF3179 domain-containing protein [Candidatus Magasanikbacteria bacterium]
MKKDIIVILSGICILIIIGVSIFLVHEKRENTQGDSLVEQIDNATSIHEENNVKRKFREFNIDLSMHSIDLNAILDGGPGKDGIPALTNPKTVSLDDVDTKEDILGILVEINDEKKYYPYNVLVWHEIINDTLGGKEIAVTFCPLCGSAIVFDRDVEGEILDFGVSGKLFESNLLMYDTQTDSLWSQAKGEAVVGEKTDTKLTRIPFQLLSFKQIREKEENLDVVSTDTGFKRDYSVYPYGDYEENDSMVFPVSVNDKRYFAKEIMYVFSLKDTSISFPVNTIENGLFSFTIEDKEIYIKKDGGEIFITDNGSVIPGYYEMWFSWATHHQLDGIVLPNHEFTQGHNEEEKETEKNKETTYSGEVLAGKTALVIDFNQEDYNKAKEEEKNIMLYFYATWCPLCKEELKDLYAAFNDIEKENIIAFRVNYKDGETQKEEKQLAKEFGVAYQHTKIFIKDGERIHKTPETWNKVQYEEEVIRIFN